MSYKAEVVVSQQDEPAIIAALAEWNANERALGRATHTWQELTLDCKLWVIRRSYDLLGTK